MAYYDCFAASYARAGQILGPDVHARRSCPPQREGYFARFETRPVGPLLSVRWWGIAW